MYGEQLYKKTITNQLRIYQSVFFSRENITMAADPPFEKSILSHVQTHTKLLLLLCSTETGLFHIIFCSIV
jgi:hypothetical protein